MQYVIYIVLAPIVAVFTFVVAVIALRRPDARLALPLSVALWLGFGFLVTNALELLWPTPGGTMLFAKLSYPFSTLIPAAVASFTVLYTGHDKWLSGRRWIVLLVIPVATSVLAFTEPLHHLIWRQVTYTPVASMLAMTVQYGWFFWVNFANAVLLLFGSFVLMIWETTNRRDTFRSQSFFVIVGILIPQILFLIYTLKLIPGFTKNFSPIAYAATGLCFMAAIRWHGFLDLVPIARRTLVEEMDEAMVVVDTQERIVDVNARARSILGLRDDVIGQTIAPDSRLGSVIAIDPSVETHKEVAIGSPVAMRYYDAHMSVVRGRGRRRIGFMVLFRDVTDTHNLLEEKNKLIDELQQASTEINTLQGIIPICMYCKKIRDDAGFWHQVENYVAARSGAQFSHGLCPDCMRKLEEGQLKQPK
ncbi:MAG TPA: histidine kinase N-terminal 7TM domain-containing protein [Spirochaetia bacterium]